MATKAIFLDLDNTIYPVPSIGDELFGTLLKMIRADGDYPMDEVRREIMRIPFQKVASRFNFGNELTARALKHLSELTLSIKILPFPDYSHLRNLPQEKYLITSGFTRLQESKIDMLGIRNEFREIFIVDPMHSAHGKKEVFQQIISDQGLQEEEIIVIGDDENSEIRAARELGLRAFLYAPESPATRDTINSFEQVADILYSESGQ